MTCATIMVAEDDVITANDLRAGLREMGYEVAVLVPTAEQAVAEARKLHPDLVLMDIVLQGTMDGISAAEYIGGTLNIPVVFLTAHADEKTLAQAKVARPYGYLVKPFQGVELRATIEMALYRANAELAIRESEERYRRLVQLSPDSITVHHNDTVLFANQATAELHGVADPGQLLTRHLSEFAYPAETTRLHPGETAHPPLEHKIVGLDGRLRDAESRTALIHYGGEPAYLTVTRDISERIARENERARLIENLAMALAQVKRLAALLPRCPICRRIRDDQGCWHLPEVMLQEQNEKPFPSVICPDCRPLANNRPYDA